MCISEVCDPLVVVVVDVVIICMMYLLYIEIYCDYLSDIFCIGGKISSGFRTIVNALIYSIYIYIYIIYIIYIMYSIQFNFLFALENIKHT